MSAPLTRVSHAFPVYEAAQRALAEAHRVDEVKVIRDKMVAMQAYARQAKDTSMIAQATEIRLRAERSLGVLLREMEKNQGAVPGKTGRKGQPVLDHRPKLADLGINKTQSSRFQALAALPPDQFESTIERSTKHAYDSMTHRMRKAAEIDRAKAEHAKTIENGCVVDDLITLAASGRRFGVIYADPPWPFETWSASGKIMSAPDNHYGTQTIEQIMALPVAQLAADNCAVLLWCTGPHGAIGTHTKTIEAWSFRPSTKAFEWIKENPRGGLHNGQGYYTLANSEDVWLGIKGSPLRLVNDVHQPVFAPVGEHSEKPEEVRRRIERLFPGPYLEL